MKFNSKSEKLSVPNQNLGKVDDVLIILVSISLTLNLFDEGRLRAISIKKQGPPIAVVKIVTEHRSQQRRMHAGHRRLVLFHKFCGTRTHQN